MNRARAYLQLVRLPNLFTAAADVLAGFLLVGPVVGGTTALATLLAASVCFYAGGTALNDAFDAARDAVERPQRPIPSGAISRKVAGVLAIALLAVGCALSASVSTRGLRLGVALAACIVLYDGVLKRTLLAAPTMGACRALNLLLGMSVVGTWNAPAHLYAAGLMWLYVTSLTHFARSEAGHSSRARLRVGTTGLCVAVVGLIGLQVFLTEADTWYLLLVGVLLGQVVAPARRALATGVPADIQNAVHAFVLSIVLLDACLVFAARGPLLAAPVLLLLVPTTALARHFRVT